VASGTADSSVAVGPSAVGPVATESNPPGDIPDNTAFVPYQQAGASFVVSIPEGWARAVVGNGVSFTDKLNTITLSSASSASSASTTSQPSVVAARQLTVPELQKAVPAFKLLDVTTVQRKAGTAVLVHYQADSAPNPVTNKVVRDDVQRYEFFRNGTEVDVTLAGPVNADNVDPWKTVTDSLQWK
jgi:hypothetical protein